MALGWIISPRLYRLGGLEKHCSECLLLEFDASGGIVILKSAVVAFAFPANTIQAIVRIHLGACRQEIVALLS